MRFVSRLLLLAGERRWTSPSFLGPLGNRGGLQILDATAIQVPPSCDDTYRAAGQRG